MLARRNAKAHERVCFLFQEISRLHSLPGSLICVRDVRCLRKSRHDGFTDNSSFHAVSHHLPAVLRLFLAVAVFNVIAAVVSLPLLA